MRNVLHKASQLPLSCGVASAQAPSRSGSVLAKAGEAVTCIKFTTSYSPARATACSDQYLEGNHELELCASPPEVCCEADCLPLLSLSIKLVCVCVLPSPNRHTSTYPERRGTGALLHEVERGIQLIKYPHRSAGRVRQLGFGKDTLLVAGR